MSSNLNHNNRNLIITGLMGSGKTTVGRLIAKRLGREFIDTDEYIEAHIGSAAHILSQPDGDDRFRLVEAQVASELAARFNLVVSTGGRFMLNQDNIKTMTRTGDVACLVADLDELVHRLLTSENETYRPRFNAAKNKLGLMQALQLQSEPYFTQFHPFQTSGCTPVEVAANIIEWFARLQELDNGRSPTPHT